MVLAAGAGRRMGTPKALLSTAAGESWVGIACRLLLEAGCERVVVVLGASAASVVVPTDAAIQSVVNEDWASGMGSSLRVGLEAASGDAALIAVVDMPELPVAVVRRVLATGAPLVRAVFDGKPGHPVLIGAAHWAAAIATLGGDRGARAYLDAHGVVDVECGDLYDGHDVDTPGG
ncbi:nucleotidyltransferase family protein [Conyzicola lurida]